MKQLDKLQTYEETLKLYGRYILRCAQRTGADEHIDDIESVASYGLWVAFNRFDETKGTFHSYAQFYIKKYIIEYLTKNTQTIYVPKSAEGVEINTISITTPIAGTDDNLTIEDLLSQPDDDKSTDDTQEAIISRLKDNLSKLSITYQKIIMMREIEEMNFNQIGEALGMTSQNASLSYNKGIKKLQLLFGLEPKKITDKRIHVKKNMQSISD